MPVGVGGSWVLCYSDASVQPMATCRWQCWSKDLGALLFKSLQREIAQTTLGCEPKRVGAGFLYGTLQRATNVRWAWTCFGVLCFFLKK